MSKRLLTVILLGPLACSFVLAQEADMRLAPSFQLKGVLISEFTRSALVNGQLVQEGDRIDGVEILAIDQEGVRVLMGSRELTVDVGGTVSGYRSSDYVTRISPKLTSQRRSQEQLAAARSLPVHEKNMQRLGSRLGHAVKPGETLSGIALQYLRDGVTMNQMMIALFQGNSQAFGDNINLLRQGATLFIPDDDELFQLAPETATAEVARHLSRWPAVERQRTLGEYPSRDMQYGPVASGATLSAIALSVVSDGVTMNQMMIALYQYNPQAFSDNINVLRQGAVLRIPSETELHQQSPEMATAEVVRQTRAWRAGYEQNALLASSPANILASNDALTN